MNIDQQNKKSMLDLIIYLFEKYFENNYQKDNIEHEKLLQNIFDAGFNNEDFKKASYWLEDFFSQQKALEKNPPKQNSIHIFTNEECTKINKECRNLILRLEYEKTLNPLVRELLILSIMALEEIKISMEQTKVVLVMVLSAQEDQNYSLACLEKLSLEPII